MKANYTELFATKNGQAVLQDLERIVNMTKIDADNPNPNSALYKCAQLALIHRIINQVSKGE
jgi:hypothetical protein